MWTGASDVCNSCGPIVQSPVVYLKTGLSGGVILLPSQTLSAWDWVFSTPRSLPRRLFQHNMRTSVVVLGNSLVPCGLFRVGRPVSDKGHSEDLERGQAHLEGQRVRIGGVV